MPLIDTIPRLGLGLGWHDAAAMTDAISAFTQGGGRLLDTAISYRNHPLIRQALMSARPQEGTFIISKLDRKSMAQRAQRAVENIRRELGVSRIDLMLIHHPYGGHTAADRATWQALVDAKQRGTCRFIGVSNIGITGIKHLASSTGHFPDALEVEYHPWVSREIKELVSWCKRRGIAVIGYGALGGASFGRGYWPPELMQIARSLRKSPEQVVLRCPCALHAAIMPPGMWRL
jgi:diketogulonate reductase-like aldo/keto reductase